MFDAGIEFSGVDGTFLKHIHLDKACLLLLVTRDGNNKLVVIAWVYCLSETSKNYQYMAKHLKLMGFAAEYMSRARHLLYSDRMKGIIHFEKEFACGHANCIVHIIKNLRQHLKTIPGARMNFHEDMVHRIQQASTQADYAKFIARFRRLARQLDAHP